MNNVFFREFRIPTVIYNYAYQTQQIVKASPEERIKIQKVNRFSRATFFGQNQEFQVATKQEQERIILCRRLIQNAVVLWNYLYLSDLLANTTQQQEIEDIIITIRNATPLTWMHINFIGEYDFTGLIYNNLRFDMQKLNAWKYQNTQKQYA